jgi:hypothetical protein
VLATIATVLFALIALNRADDRELIESIVTALVGAFSAIVGVYFGARSAESAVETVTAATPPPTGPVPSAMAQPPGRALRRRSGEGGETPASA